MAAETSADPPGDPDYAEGPTRGESGDPSGEGSSTPPEVASDGSSPAEPMRPPEAVVTPAPERIVAIGDTHGDLAGLRAALSLAGAVDADGRWAGLDGAALITLIQSGRCA
jgi:hypothetical protein